MNKETIIAQFEEVLQKDNFKEIQAEVSNIRASFRKITDAIRKEALDAFKAEGGEEANFEASKDEQDEKYDRLIAFFNEKKAAYQAAREAEQQQREEERKKREAEQKVRLQEQQAVIEELTAFVQEGDVSTAGFQRFKDIQSKWNTTGRINTPEGKEQLSKYSHQVDLYFHQRNLAKEMQGIEQQRNMSAKQEIISKIEGLLGEENMNEVADAMKKLQAEWKTIGQVAWDKKDEVYSQFRQLSDQVYEKIQVFFDEKRVQTQENLNKKLDLIERTKNLVAEDCTTHEQWEAKTKDVMALQEEWKTIGFSNDNEITWQTFRATCDIFFEKKKEYYGDLDKFRQDNKNHKIELCEKAEAVRFDTDWARTSNYLVQLQKEWKKVGPAQRNEEHKLWERFRLACDTFFQAKKVHFDSMDTEQSANLQAKNDLIERLKVFEPSGDGNDFDTLDTFTKEWKAIGFVPLTDKDRLQKEYNSILDQKYNAARKLRNESGKSFRNTPRSENTRVYRSNNNNSGGGKEDALRERIERKAQEIAQYENNLGFLTSASKKESPIITDLKSKLQKLKDELKGLEDSLKAATRPAPVVATPATEEVTTNTEENSNNADETVAEA